jgi:hypothetical protein
MAFPKHWSRMKQALEMVIREFHQALTETMHDFPAYVIIVKSINARMDFLGRECILDLFTDLVDPIQSLIPFLEQELFAAGLSNIKAVQKWLRELSLDLFVGLCDIHSEHKPKPMPVALPLVESKIVDDLYF